MLHGINNILNNKNSRPQKHSNRFKYWAALSLFAVSIFSTLSITPANALTTSDSDPRGYSDQIKSVLYYRAINYCFKNSELSNPWDWWFGSESITNSNANSYKWFDPGESVAIGLYMKDSISKMDDRGYTGCDNTSLISSAINFWGLRPVEVLCSSGFKRDGVQLTGDKDKDMTNCVNGGDASFVMEGSRDNSASKFTDYIKNKVYDGKDIPSLSSPQLYVYYLHSLDQSCITSIGGVPGIDSGSYLAPDPDKTYEKYYEKGLNDVSWVNTKNNPADIIKGSYPTSLNINTYNLAAEPNDINAYSSIKKSSCYSIAKSMSDYSDDYQTTYNKWAKINKSDAETIVQEAGNQPQGQAETTSSCEIEGVGWIVCPTLKFLGEASDVAFNFLAKELLQTDVSIVSTDTSSGNEPSTYNAWKVIRDIANIAFVIAFLIIIFSQVTSVGITNYGIKKMLPRLVIAAILVNISFFICQIAVDLSNIVGYSVHSIFGDVATSISMSDKPLTDQSDNTLGIATLVAAGIAGGVGVLTIISIPLILAVLLALLMIVLILIARTALIILLVVVSPLAFVAYLLPNTESLFKKWYKLFSSLLLLFPIIGLLFGAGTLASSVLSASAGDNKVMQFIAIGVAVVPLFAVPSVLKNSLSAFGSIGAKLSGLSTKANSLVGSKAKSGAKSGWDSSIPARYAKYKSEEMNKRNSLIRSGAYKGSKNPLTWAGAARSAANKSIYGKMGEFGNQTLARGYEMADALDATGIKNATSYLDNTMADGRPISQDQMMELALGRDLKDASGNTLVKSDSFIQRAAIQKAAKIATVGQAHQLVDASSGMSAGARKTLSSTLASAGIAGKAPYLGGKTLGDIEQGTTSVDKASLEALQKRKITAESLANSDPDAINQLIKVAQSTQSGSIERQNLVAAYEQLTSPAASKLYAEKVTKGSKLDDSLNNIIGLV